MHMILKMKNGSVKGIYVFYETESRYYLGDWNFIRKSDVAEILDQFVF